MKYRLRKIFTFILPALALGAVASCAKEPDSTEGENSKLQFEAWMEAHYPTLTETVGNGVYILEDIEGDGAEVKDDAYIFVNYSAKNLYTGEYSTYTYESIARQLGKYKSNSYYGPIVSRFKDGIVNVGLRDGINGNGESIKRMRIGGKRTFIVPGWLATTLIYDSPEKYVESFPDGIPFIYTVEIAGQTDDIRQWQIQQIKDYIAQRHLNAETTVSDSIYYASVKMPEEKKLGTDTTVYINYIGRRLDGKVFDTNIADTAKKYGIYSSGTTYSPKSVTTATDSTAYKLSDSEVIKGFSLTLWKMHAHETGIGIFTSGYGYGEAGSGSAIPGYAPLAFEIEIVDKP